jgi:TatD DNase family protein
MRAGANVARTLLNAGCYLSYGPRFSPEALSVTPLDRLLIETDDSDMAITAVAAQVAAALNLSPAQVAETAAGNAQRLLIR